MADKLAQDLYAVPRRHVKIYANGAPDAEDTWVGTCALCRTRHVTNLDPALVTTMPGWCDMGGGGNGKECGGTVLLDPNWEGLLAAFKVGGWDALNEDRTLVTHNGKITVS